MVMQKFTPIQYLMIDVANNFGLDQQDWDDRLDWFKAHEHELEGIIKQAKEPALYFAGVQAYRAAQRGEAISYPISLDATSSGAQILSILIGCRQSASLCNVVDAGKRMDLYTSHYQAMCAEAAMPVSISRKEAKQAINR